MDSSADNQQQFPQDMDENLEHQVFKALVENGQVIPETEEDVRSAEQWLAKKKNKPLPGKFHDARSVLSRIKGHQTLRNQGKTNG